MIVIGDAHAKSKAPFEDAINSFFKWLYDTYPTDTKVFLGDLFDSSSPHNTVRHNIMSWIASSSSQVYVLTGNHDTSKRQGNSLDPLKCLKNVQVIDAPTQITIEGQDCWFLPYAPRTVVDAYPAIKGVCDYVFTHITPPEAAFGSEGVQINLTARKAVVHGHTHLQKDFRDKQNRHIILGVPLPTRHLEEQQEHRALEIVVGGDMKFVPVPQTFTFETIKFGDTPSSANNILNIVDAPDIKSVYDQYKGCHIRREGITVLATDGDYSEQKFSVGSMGERFMEFAKERAVSQEVLDCFAQYQEA